MSRAPLLLFLLSCAPAADPELQAFTDAARPQADRVRALQALRKRDPEARRKIYPAARRALERELARGSNFGMSELETEAFAEAAAWLAEMKEPGARLEMELYLDREVVRQKRLPDRALVAAALGLEAYPESASAREVLWAALRDPAERSVVRAACLKSLTTFHPKDFEERLLAVKAKPGDSWLEDLQARLTLPRDP